MGRQTTRLSSVCAPLLGTTLLGMAGGFTVAAAVQRWWPACGIGAFDTGACLRLQDHAYDFTVPRDPWVPLGAAAELQGLALLFLAGAVPFLPALLAARRPGLALSLASQVVAAGVAALAVVVWLSGRTAEVVTVSGLWVAGLLWVVGLPALVLVAVASAEPASGRVWAGRWAAAGCVLASHPFGQLIVAPLLLGYTSHDTTPWTEAVSGLFLVGAAVFVGLVHRKRRGPPEDEGVSVASRATTA